MSKTLRVLSILAIFVLLLSAVGCGGASGRAALYGKWNFSYSDSSYIWEFTADGKMFIGEGEMQLETTYVFVDDDTATIKAPAGTNGEDLTFDFKIEGDNLSLTSNGVTQVLTRIK